MTSAPSCLLAGVVRRLGVGLAAPHQQLAGQAVDAAGLVLELLLSVIETG